MTEDVLRLAVLITSVREDRFGPVPARWFAAEAQRHPEFEVELIDLADFPLPLELGPVPPAIAQSVPRPDEMAGLSQALADADAFVLVTPEYNSSFPASLKAAIDWHYAEWRGKPVGFVAYGGPGGGLRAVEQLRLVFAQFHAHTTRNTVSFPKAWERFDLEGQPEDLDAASGAAEALLDELAWWGKPLRMAREEGPIVSALI